MLETATRRKQGLKQTLERFYREYDFKNRVLYDPIELPHRYKRPEDIEAAGLIASCLAYGKVGLFKPVIARILSGMGKSPHSFLMDLDVRKQKYFITFKYRFNEPADILCLLFIMHTILKSHSTFERAFMKHYHGDDLNTGGIIAGFVDKAMAIDTSVVYGKNIKPYGLTQFFPSPEKGSACKRINLFLRWMIRDRDIDFGIWKDIPKDKLIIPLDTHIARISRCLGFTRRTTSDWKAAVDITEALKRLDPEDPLKYDFALCHHGISGLCNPKDRSGCMECAFSEFS